MNGKVRAKQYYLNDSDRSKVCGIILHGDGSHSGQGVVYETKGQHPFVTFKDSFFLFTSNSLHNILYKNSDELDAQ